MTRSSSQGQEQNQNRLHLFFAGHVQGVGFRYTANVLAQRYAVTGRVRNRSDGRVELVVEGSEAEIEKYIADLAQEMSEHIDNTERAWQPATGEWDSFTISPTY